MRKFWKLALLYIWKKNQNVFRCANCNKEFNRKDNLKRNKIKCDLKNNLDIKNTTSSTDGDLKINIINQNNKILELEKKLNILKENQQNEFTTSEILNLASVAAYSAGVINYGKVN